MDELTSLSHRLRIAFVADCVEGELGGGVVSAQRFLSRLEEEQDVVIVGSGPERNNRVRMPRIPLPRGRMMGFSFAWPVRKQIRRAIAASDVVHLQFPFWLSFVAMEEARRLGKPVVAAFHVQPENLLYNIGVRSPRAADALFRFWVQRYYDRADVVLCPTPFAEEKLREHGLGAPVAVVSNGYAPHLVCEPCEREPEHAGRFLILMVGRFGQEKRQDLLLRALRECQHHERISVVIGGKGPLELELRRLASRLRCPVEIGYLSNERLSRLLNSADLFVHASEVELEGMAVLDAMSVGLPALIAQADQSAASAFALDDCFRFPAGDAHALAKRIDALIETPTVLARARLAARALAREFDFSESIRDLGRVYAALAASPSRRRLAENLPSSPTLLGGRLREAGQP